MRKAYLVWVFTRSSIRSTCGNDNASGSFPWIMLNWQTLLKQSTSRNDAAPTCKTFAVRPAYRLPMYIRTEIHGSNLYYI